MQDESIGKIIKIAVAVCIVCSILVSTAAVTLDSIQTRNKHLDKIKNILKAGDLLSEGQEIEQIYKDYIEPVMIELETGTPVPEEEFNDELNIRDFNIKEMSAHPQYSIAVPPKQDIADIKRKPKYMVVYQVIKGDSLDKIILPIYGKGLWSTMYGFMALDSNMRTIRGLTFYEHGETPGLGGEIDNPRWQQQWNGKLAYDENWNVEITVLKGQVDPGRPQAKYQIDGLAGATITTRGVDLLVKYWLGDQGYGPYLSKLRAGGQNEQG